MFHKRLLNEFQDNKPYVYKMVFTQWISLLANICMIGSIAFYLQLLRQNQVMVSDTIKLIGVILAVIIVRRYMTKKYSYLSFCASTNVKKRLREKIYNKLMELGGNYRKEITTAEAVQISTEGVEQLEIYFGNYMPQFFYSLLAPLTLFAVVTTMSFKVAIALLLFVPLIPISIVAIQKFAKKMLNKYWGTYTELGDSFLESIQGLTTLKIYGVDEKYAKKMDVEAEKFRKITMRVLIMQLNSISVMDMVAYGGAALGMILAVMEYQKGILSFGQCFFIIMVSAEFFLPLRLLGSFFHIAMNGNAAANKIFRLFDMKVEPLGQKEQMDDMTIEFRDVSFSYDEKKEVLKHVSFVLPKGKMVALVGESGSGKSTITSLILRKNRKFKGEILLGNTSILDYSEKVFYQNIIRIGHDSYLFQGTVEDNLRMGKEDATKEEMIDVLKQVDLYDFVKEKGGLSMEVTEKAANLSGGQKQRLALARGLLQDGKFYIFDEATSNVDVESENKIMEVIKKLSKTKMVLLISHRLENSVDADQIYVLDRGQIVENGTHNELMERKQQYFNLYTVQKNLEDTRKIEVEGEEQ